jgi:hypothetical protein
MLSAIAVPVQALRSITCNNARKTLGPWVFVKGFVDLIQETGREHRIYRGLFCPIERYSCFNCEKRGQSAVAIQRVVTMALLRT